MQVIKYRSCPCCGGQPQWMALDKSGRGYIRCQGDDIETRIFKTEAEAWAAWDKRTVNQNQ